VRDYYCGPYIPRVDEDHTPEHVRRVCDVWVGNRADFFRTELDLDDPQVWWDITEQVLAPSGDRVMVIQSQLLASALFKIAQLEQAAIDSSAERDA
jgi:hypothetical protein